MLKTHFEIFNTTKASISIMIYSKLSGVRYLLDGWNKNFAIKEKVNLYNIGNTSMWHSKTFRNIQDMKVKKNIFKFLWYLVLEYLWRDGEILKFAN